MPAKNIDWAICRPEQGEGIEIEIVKKGRAVSGKRPAWALRVEKGNGKRENDVVGLSRCTFFYRFLTECTPRASHLILYIPPEPLFTHLLQRRLEALEDLATVSIPSALPHTMSHLKLDLGLGNVSLAAAAVGDLLGLGDLVLDGLFLN